MALPDLRFVVVLTNAAIVFGLGSSGSKCFSEQAFPNHRGVGVPFPGVSTVRFGMLTLATTAVCSA